MIFIASFLGMTFAMVKIFLFVDVFCGGFGGGGGGWRWWGRGMLELCWLWLLLEGVLLLSHFPRFLLGMVWRRKSG